MKLKKMIAFKEISFVSLCVDLLDSLTMLKAFLAYLLSPQKVQFRSIMAAEVMIYCVQSRSEYVAEQLKKSIQKGQSLFLSDYLNTEERCKWIMNSLCV